MTVPVFEASNSALERDGKVRWISPEPPRRDKVVRIADHATVARRVIILDRDSMSSDLLANALARDSGFEAAVIHPSSMLSALASGNVDLVVIGAEVKLESDTGFDLATSASEAHPEIPVVLLLNDVGQVSVLQAFRSGARGVFSRQQPMAEFLDCIEHVYKGFIWAGKVESDFLLTAVRNFPAPSALSSVDSSALTAREMQVVQSAAVGKTNKAIAGELGLSEHTVKNYLFRAFEKLGVSSRVELLFYLTMRGHKFSPDGTHSSDDAFSAERTTIEEEG